MDDMRGQYTSSYSYSCDLLNVSLEPALTVFFGHMAAAEQAAKATFTSDRYIKLIRQTC